MKAIVQPTVALVIALVAAVPLPKTARADTPAAETAEEKDPQPATPKKSADGAAHVDAAAAAELLADEDAKTKPTVLDIRTPDEFQSGHIEGARNIDFLDSAFEKEIRKLDRDQPYLVHCASGGRSTRALETFKQLGFNNIIHLDGGMKAWRAADQPVVKESRGPSSP